MAFLLPHLLEKKVCVALNIDENISLEKEVAADFFVAVVVMVRCSAPGRDGTARVKNCRAGVV